MELKNVLKNSFKGIISKNKTSNKPGFAFGETLINSTLGPSSEFPEIKMHVCWMGDIFFKMTKRDLLLLLLQIPFRSSSFSSIKGFSSVGLLRLILAMFRFSGTSWKTDRKVKTFYWRVQAYRGITDASAQIYGDFSAIIPLL